MGGACRRSQRLNTPTSIVGATVELAQPLCQLGHLAADGLIPAEEAVVRRGVVFWGPCRHVVVLLSWAAGWVSG